jgi:aminoglycoside phosphotransferase (APT) family kinase protein
VNLTPVLDYLAKRFPTRAECFDDWLVQPVEGGHNNRLARISGPQGDLVVKFYRGDKRDRAGREYRSLDVLQKLGLEIAPAVVLIERERYANPVTVQHWLSGNVCEGPPASESEWQKLVDLYLAIHSVTPERVGAYMKATEMATAVMTFKQAQEAVDLVLGEIGALHEGFQRPDLLALTGRLARMELPCWDEPDVRLARCDPSSGNFLRRAGDWAAVDWEYAGWGDPAFEIGDFMTHPHYQAIGQDQWDWFVGEMTRANSSDLGFKRRVWIYFSIMLVRWTGVFSRYWQQRDSGTVDSHRLGQFSAEWWAALPEQYAHYHFRAEQALRLI